MAVPKRRTTRAKRDSRRAQHDKMQMPTLSTCPNCGAINLRHRACASCGTYRGKQVVKVLSAAAPESQD